MHSDRELNLKKEVLLPVLRAIGDNTTLKGLDVSGTFRHGTLGAKVFWRGP